MNIIFPETLLNAVVGRNGELHFGGINLLPLEKRVMMTPLGHKGNQLRAGMVFMASDCGEVARALAESAVKADPGVREQVADQLRAALVAIETGANEELDDSFSDFSVGFR